MTKLYLMGINSISEEKLWEYYSEGENISSYRKEKMQRLKQSSDRINNIASAYLLNEALKVHSLSEKDMEYGTNEWGKPYFAKRPDIHFSISHTKGAVALLISDCECGVDIEGRRENYERVINKAFTDKEREYLKNTTDKEYTFARLWTLKESFIKAVGQGMSYGLSEFEVADENGIISLVVSKDKREFHIENPDITFCGNEYSVSIAVEKASIDTTDFEVAHFFYFNDI